MKSFFPRKYHVWGLILMVFASCTTVPNFPPQFLQEPHVVVIQDLPQPILENKQPFFAMFMWSSSHGSEMSTYMDSMDSKAARSILMDLLQEYAISPDPGYLEQATLVLREGRVPRGESPWVEATSGGPGGRYMVFSIPSWGFRAGSLNPVEGEIPDFGYFSVVLAVDLVDTSTNQSLWHGTYTGTVSIRLKRDLEKKPWTDYITTAMEGALGQLGKVLPVRSGLQR